MVTSSWSSTGTAWIFNPDTGEFRSITTHRSGYDMGNRHAFESEPVVTDVTDFSWEEATDPIFMAWVEDSVPSTAGGVDDEGQDEWFTV